MYIYDVIGPGNLNFKLNFQVELEGSDELPRTVLLHVVVWSHINRDCDSGDIEPGVVPLHAEQ